MTNKILCVIEWAANKVRRKFDVFYVARTKRNVMTTSAPRNTFMVTWQLEYSTLWHFKHAYAIHIYMYFNFDQRSRRNYRKCIGYNQQ